MWSIEVRGVVQGVGFRPSVKRAATSLGARGFVRNDGSHVTIGTDLDPGAFLAAVRSHMGPMARVDWTRVREMDWADLGLPGNGPEGFSILPSTKGENDSSLPMDTAICERCLSEMLDPGDRRFLHPFTNCTDCGARFTVIESLPYDRERTTMKGFPPCQECIMEYSDENERRFHAQTLSCPSDGPRYRFLDRSGRASDGPDPFADAARVINDGGIISIKGWGGLHLVCKPSRLLAFREWYRRPFKPFAIMVKDIRTAEEVAEVTEVDRSALLSPARPIILLKKRDNPATWAADILEMASPGLGSIGLYLPYAGVHHLLLRALELAPGGQPWLVMTSANAPGDPMALDPKDLESLGADGHLVHDRPIAARCDDSVLVPNPLPEGSYRSGKAAFGIRAFPIRRSRGLVPDPLPMPHSRRVISLGAERNVTVTVSREGRSYTSQYIGNPSRPLVLDYARQTVGRMMELFGIGAPEVLGADLHPRYVTSRWAKDISEGTGAPVIGVQHHHAHAASLLVDSGLEGMGAVVVDGVGYGDDGMPWGGEAIATDLDSWKRVGHLEPFGLPGGDSAVYHPDRIAHWLSMASGHCLELGDASSERVLEAMKGKVVMTSSLGRLLDALSALMLGVTWRSYDGEPAMRLERLLASSRRPMKELFSEKIMGGSVPVVPRWKTLLDEVVRHVEGPLRPGLAIDLERAADLSMGLVAALIDDLVTIAKDGAERFDNGTSGPFVGLSGGVAYDLPIVKAFHGACARSGCLAVLHSRVPPGDGGISVGQSAVAGRKL